MKKTNNTVAEKLLKIKAVKLQPTMPFTWASGWKSPIYCDNRKTLSYPEVRTFIRDAFCKVIREKFPQAEVVAGVATGAIAHGVLVAEELGLPFIYVRSSPKDHGLENLIEGDVKPHQKVVVLEDLISTGGSSLKAVDAVRRAGCEVVGMAAIFTYEFPQAIEAFEDNSVQLYTLSNYSSVIDEALKVNYIAASDVQTLKKWRKDPANWKPEN